MGRAAQVYDFTLGAGQLVEILAEGSYYRILTATGALQVQRDDGSRVGPILEGQGERNSPFKRLTLRDLSGAANSGTVLVCDGDFVDHRQAGAAEVVSGAYRTTREGIAYWGGTASAIGAADFSHVQLWNPAGSGRILVLETLQISVDSGSVALRRHTAALANLATAPANKFLGGAAGVGEVRHQANASAIGTSFNGSVGASFGQSPINFLNRPVIIPAGHGLIVSHNTVNINTRAMFEWLELPA